MIAYPNLNDPDVFVTISICPVSGSDYVQAWCDSWQIINHRAEHRGSLFDSQCGEGWDIRTALLDLERIIDNGNW